MSNISKINVDGVVYDIEDTVARGEISNLESQLGNLSNLQTTTKTDLVSAINEAMESGGGLDLSDLTMTAVQSQTEGFSTLNLSDGETTKSVDIPVASLSDTDTTLITNIVNAYLDTLVNGDEVSY